MHWTVKSRHWIGLHRQDDPTTDSDRFKLFDAGELDIVVAWGIAMGMFLVFLVSSALS
jgi:hypothetical protein